MNELIHWLQTCRGDEGTPISGETIVFTDIDKTKLKMQLVGWYDFILTKDYFPSVSVTS